MQYQSDTMNDPSVREAIKLASTPAGQELLAMLKQSGGDAFQAAMQKAENGEYEDAKKLISGFLRTPEAKALLDRLGR